MATANSKATHYHASLTGALLRGAWAEGIPGTAPNGSELSWGELIRKWGKHTGGNTALIHYLRDISLLYLSSTAHPNTASSSNSILYPSQPITSSPRGTVLAADGPNSSNSSADGVSNSTGASASGSSFIHVPHPHFRHKDRTAPIGPLIASASGSTLRQSQDGSRSAYLSARDLDGDDNGEESAWSEGGTWWSGVGFETIDEVKDSAKALEGLITSGKLRPGEMLSARMTLGYHLHALGQHEAAVKVLLEAGEGDPRRGALEGDAAVLERIRTRCLQGVSLELAPSPHLAFAVQSYLSVISLTRSLSTFPFPIPPYLLLAPAQAPKIPFETHREIHRHLSTSLSRAAIISARQPNALPHTLRILRTYHAYSTAWPATFRSRQRQRMLQLYLRALLAAYPPAGIASDNPYLLDEGVSTLPARVTWRKEVVEAIRIGRTLLTATTTFPRAGTVNLPVTTFTEVCVALTDRCPLLSREVISVLWWAQTLTFQSQPIFRHITRLLTAVGDSADARRTFELYVQLVLKSRQTQQPDVSLQLKRRPTEDVPAGPVDIKRQAEEAEDRHGSQAEGRKSQTSEAEGDTDEEFIEALLAGTRLLVRDLQEPEDAWDYVCLAGDVAINGDRRGRSVTRGLRARMEECKGVTRMSMAMLRSDTVTRPKYQAQSLNHLLAATRLDSSSPTAFYHLAFCQAEARSIEAATQSVRNALEIDSGSVQTWQLLALLLTAQNDWSGAAKAGEAGVSVWEQEDELDRIEEEGPLGNPSENDPAIESKDFAATAPPPAALAQSSSEPLLEASGAFRSPRQPTPSSSRSQISRVKRLQNVIQLRMTLNIIAEKVQGPEVAMLRQQELFSFFSARSGKQRGQGYSRGMPGSASVTSFVERGLGESFVSVDQPKFGRGLGESIISVPPPAPTIVAEPETISPQTSRTAAVQSDPTLVVHSANSSPGGSTASSDVGTDEKSAEKEGRRVSGGHRLLGKHLHVPHPIAIHSSRPDSVRRASHGAEASEGLGIHRNRLASVSSTNLSIAPTVIHSHFHQSIGRTPPVPPPAQAVADHGRTPAESRILSNLWLMSAATFRRWGKLEQCLVAIEEAEILDPENADVWVQLGLYHVSLHPPANDLALPAFTKSLLLRPDHPPAVVSLAKLYLSTGQVELAHSLLNQLTQDAGWDVPEAWYYLGKVCEAQDRSERARECWVYALGLEESRSARRWADAIDRWL